MATQQTFLMNRYYLEVASSPPTSWSNYALQTNSRPIGVLSIYILKVGALDDRSPFPIPGLLEVFAD